MNSPSEGFLIVMYIYSIQYIGLLHQIPRDNKLCKDKKNILFYLSKSLIQPLFHEICYALLFSLSHLYVYLIFLDFPTK